MKHNMLKKLTMTIMAGFLVTQVVPASANPAYTTVEGDTFYSISNKLNMDMESLMKFNPNIHPSNVYTGLSIKLPVAATAATAAATKTTKSTKTKQNTETAKAASTINTQSKVIQVKGKKYTYKSSFNVRATAYTSAASENGSWGAVDSLGQALKLGTIAVDPKVIPLGSKVYITGYNHKGLPVGGFVGTASDVGGAIKGKRIDIFVGDSQASAQRFGVQNVKVYVLKA